MPDIEIHGPLFVRSAELLGHVMLAFKDADYAGDLTFSDHRVEEYRFQPTASKPFVRVFGSLPMRETHGPDIRKRLRDLNVFEGIEWVEISWRPM